MSLPFKLTGYQLFVITGLLILLCYSQYGFYTFMAVFSITTVATYICYTLNTQLRLDGFFKFLIYFGIGVPRHVVAVDEEDFTAEKNHIGLKIFQKPIEKVIKKFINSIIEDFIRTWYTSLGSDEEEFIAEVRTALEYIITELYLQLEKADIHEIIVNLIRMFQRHIKVFHDFRNIVQRKYPGISERDFSNCITELYEEGMIKHIATYSKGNEMDYLKTLLDILLYRFLPENAFSCEAGRFMLREILAIQLLEPLVKELTDSHFVNQAVIDILEPSIPITLLKKAWQDSITEIQYEEKMCELDVGSSCAEICDKNEETVEDRSLKFSSVQNCLSESTELNENEKVFLHFDNLDRSRTSAPVYGSKSARDHEIRKSNKSKLPRASSHHEPEKKHTEFDDVGHTTRKNLCDSVSDNQDYISDSGGYQEIWNVCPPSTAKIFRKNSFLEKSRHQDELTEKIKAKVKAIRPVTTSLNTCVPTTTNQTLFCNDAKKEVAATQQQVTDVIEVTNPQNEVVKVHSSGSGGAFYQIAPSCPTCIEMTLMASPFENDKAQVVMNQERVFEHMCGLNEQHYYYAEAENESILFEPLDDQSFASCSDNTDEFSDESYSSGTLLASAETTESGSKNYLMRKNSQCDSYDIVSSCSEISNSDNSVDNSLSSDDIEKHDLYGSFRHRTPSVVTFKTAIENSVSLHKSETMGVTQNPPEASSTNQILKFFKSSLPSIRKKKRKYCKGEKINRKYKIKNKMLPAKRNKKYKTEAHKYDFPQMESSSISTSVTRFNSLPDNTSSILSHIDWNRHDGLVDNFIEEVGLEVNEQYLDEFEDVPSHSNPVVSMEPLIVDPLSEVITVTEMDVESRAMNKTAKPVDLCGACEDKDVFIPIFEGKIIMPHPSKLPAAWLYPIQMISIPTTEVAYEKGWERGINKYTLYNIHYDIRIWPEQYEKQFTDAESQKNGTENPPEPHDSVPLIREIKRRYREFLFLHNRLTHGHLAKFMKGILRPNRRYAMPFGRMDPDVIEGRRKILETYLVSLVSRPELCNSREYKDFLGTEDHDHTYLLKPKKVGQKQILKQNVQKMVGVEPTDDGGIIQGVKEQVEKLQPDIKSDVKSAYFIHGYEVQRMFGYAEENCRETHSASLFTYFVDNYDSLQDAVKMFYPPNVIASFETIQRPQMFVPNDFLEEEFQKHFATKAVVGVERPEQNKAEARYDASIDDQQYVEQKSFHELSHSIHIAAKFSEELAAQLHKDKESLALALEREKDLYQSSWPLTDAVLSIASQVLKSYGSWLTFERVQQAILFSMGGIIEWLIGREINELVMQERCFKYLKDLYTVVWDEQDKLKERRSDPTEQERKQVKDEALKRIMEFIPSLVMMSVGADNYKKCCQDLLHTLQYQNINRHVLYAALEIILLELVPELRSGYTQYANKVKNNSL